MNNRLLYSLLVFVGAVWLLSPILIPCLYPRLDHRGQFGDQFGTVNALFSGLAFAVIFCSLHAQSQESKVQEERFTKESEAQAKNFQKQLELAALTSYANLSLELWLHCERNLKIAQSEHNEKNATEFDEARKTRHREMTAAREELETLLKSSGLLAKVETKASGEGRVNEGG